MRDKWLEARQRHLTATAVPLLFGFNKFKSIRDLVDEKLHGVVSDFKESLHTRRGKVLECAVLKALNIDLGIDATPFSRSFLDYLADAQGVDNWLDCGDNSYFFNDLVGIGATPDAYDAERPEVLIECKAPQSAARLTWLAQPPIDYLVQCHTQMAVIPYSREVLLSALFANNDLPLLVWQIPRSQEIIDIISDEAMRFWQEREEYQVDYIKAGTLFQMIKDSYKLIHCSEVRKNDSN